MGCLGKRTCPNLNKSSAGLYRQLRETWKISLFVSRYTHPSYSLHTLLPSGKRYRSVRCLTTRLQSGFFPQGVRLLNSSSTLFLFLRGIKGLQHFCCITLCCKMTIKWTVELLIWPVEGDQYMLTAKIMLHRIPVKSDNNTGFFQMHRYRMMIQNIRYQHWYWEQRNGI